ncbi:NAD(P)/FAD-dependent oxidoreductase [Lichenihabitans psoromatis]|uniref:NAD(P)/FAD-dependent oxidoreductase n=1 Tax=Lichenihabitans psoromatis TaxID=2528642 RepID=UPI0010358A5E|nr:NAD(P)/FAD-dependent oxidoreductase [Lichenihabitans psoromatis]
MGSPDLLVIGAGPAGIEAALAAASCGLAVTLVDEAPAAGGQVYRAPPAAFSGGSASPERKTGDALRARLAASPVTVVFDHMVWSISPGFRVDALGPDGPRSWRARAVVTATGAQERVVPFPGWTLPGVTGLAGATILLKSQGMLPGRRTLVAGCGPLLLAVAVAILKAGGDVAAVVDLSSRRDWLSRGPALLARPDLAARGTAWVSRLMAAGVPLLTRQGVRRAEAMPDGRLDIVIGPVDAARRPIADGRERHFTVDAAAVGHGLTPSTDVTRLLRAEHLFDDARGGWLPLTDAEGRTSIPLLFATGDGAGLAGAAAAATDGRLAGLAVARDLGALPASEHQRISAKLKPAAARARRFGRAMASLMALRPGQIDAIPPDAIVCRCEDVTRAEIEAAMREGSATANQVKAWTRCGMGPCQGRICGDIVGALLVRAGASRDTVGHFTGRSPFRPLPLDQLTGDVAYADLILPPPAPL